MSTDARSVVELERALARFERLLLAAAREDTAYPPLRSQWSPRNPASMHCAMFALATHERFGVAHAGQIEEGLLRYPRVAQLIPHYQNVLDGRSYDLSRSQHPVGYSFHRTRLVSPETVLALPDREAERFALFRGHLEVMERNPQIVLDKELRGQIPHVPLSYAPAVHRL